jgi:hypothetical protein
MRTFRLTAVTALVLVSAARFVMATPSTTYWTPSVSDIQPFGIWHLGVDNYFTVDRKADSGQQGSLPADLGVTVGILPFKKLQMEVGVDALYASDNPYYFNAKIGTPENSIFAGSPALNVGIFNVGTKRGETDYNIADFIVGRTLPWNLGRVHAGGYTGNRKLLVSAGGIKEEAGWMVGYDRAVIKDKVLFAADYASGDNAIGGGGAGIYYFFSKDVSLLVGPVWFNDREINGHMKWTVQLDINL